MQLTSRHELAFLTATLTYRGTRVEVPDVLVDTGAASSVLNAEVVADAGIYLASSDRLRRLRGVGGHEYVFLRQVDRLAVGDHGLDSFDVEIGAMDCGFEIGGSSAWISCAPHVRSLTSAASRSNSRSSIPTPNPGQLDAAAGAAASSPSR